jgi:hypothetical protein
MIRLDLAAMNHRYIDDHSLAERYVANALPPAERAAFETHMVDCEQCTERVLLAKMFQVRKPAAKIRLPLRARIAADLKPWQLLVIFALAALLLLGIPTVLVPAWQFLRK